MCLSLPAVRGTLDETPADQAAPGSDPTPDPLALVGRLVELGGLALSLWWVWNMCRREPEFVELRRRTARAVGRMRQRVNFARRDLMLAEAGYIATRGAR